MEIVYEKMQLLDSQMEKVYGPTVEQIQDKNTHLVDVLHSLDYDHSRSRQNHRKSIRR